MISTLSSIFHDPLNKLPWFASIVRRMPDCLVIIG